jgi:glycosyltransferase involved in cell wall biosynthesis
MLLIALRAVGGGTRLKIFEAIAMGKAIVSTRIGAEGLPVRDGDELLPADDPPSFAAAVVRLLQDRALARRLGAGAEARVRQDFGWAAVTQQFTAPCERVAHAEDGIY